MRYTGVVKAKHEIHLFSRERDRCLVNPQFTVTMTLHQRTA
ncbi:Uncharacterised protein [Vibrio cholerae]|nr:Uncharacterised protein [Vibrio cholerae]CSI77719.1 Uncharacterised protein [Vibrio cholerae]